MIERIEKLKKYNPDFLDGLKEVDIENWYCEILNEIPSESIPEAFINIDFAKALKDQDNCAYREGLNNYADMLEQNQTIITLDNGGTYLDYAEVESLVESLEDEIKANEEDADEAKAEARRENGE